MKKYREIINEIEIISSPQIDTTTGDLEYEGTALEVLDQQGNDLFHVVISENGERQLLFWDHKKPFRIKLEEFEKIIMIAKKKVILADLELP